MRVIIAVSFHSRLAYTPFIYFLYVLAQFPTLENAFYHSDKKTCFKQRSLFIPFNRLVDIKIVYIRVHSIAITSFNLFQQNSVPMQNRRQMNGKNMHNRKRAMLSVRSEGDTDGIAAGLKNHYNICAFHLYFRTNFISLEHVNAPK